MNVSSICMIALAASRMFMSPEEEPPRRRGLDTELQQREWQRSDLQSKASLLDAIGESAFDPSRILPPSPNLDPRTNSLTVSKLDPEEQAFLKFMSQRRLDWLSKKSSDPKREASYLEGLSLGKKLKLLVSAFNDFNRSHRVEDRTTAASAELSPLYRMAAMLNESSKSTYKVRPLDPAEMKKRMQDHIVVSYFMAVLMDNKNVAFFRNNIVKENPELQKLFTARQLELMESEEPHIDSYHRELDERVMSYFLRDA